jgi:ferritin-like metal-binding protein YciE
MDEQRKQQIIENLPPSPAENDDIQVRIDRHIKIKAGLEQLNQILDSADARRKSSDKAS